MAELSYESNSSLVILLALYLIVVPNAVDWS